MSFFASIIRALLDAGYTVDLATNDTDFPVPACYQTWGCRVYTVPFSRNPFAVENLSAAKALSKLVAENGYDVVHCHTPVAAAYTRLCCRSFRKNGMRIFYTAHGFHFYCGAPLSHWIYYPVEKICARFTDLLITINTEDYAFAKKKLHASRIEYVPGVGVNIEKFANAAPDRAAKRQMLGVPSDAILLLSVGELNDNKNHRAVIEALERIGDPRYHYMIAGDGPNEKKLRRLAKKKHVPLYLLGYRDDIDELLKVTDLFVHPSRREGLPVALMECLASGTPCIASYIRGHRDLLNDNMFDLSDPSDLTERILHHGESPCLDERFSVEQVNRRMLALYGIGGGEQNDDSPELVAKIH